MAPLIWVCNLALGNIEYFNKGIYNCCKHVTYPILVLGNVEF